MFHATYVMTDIWDMLDLTGTLIRSYSFGVQMHVNDYHTTTPGHAAAELQ